MSIETILVGDQSIVIDARWDSEAGVWIATGQNIHGLVVEADTWPRLIEEIQLIVPDLLEFASTMKSGANNVR
jgi:Domain of unknown function (DUF1902)